MVCSRPTAFHCCFADFSALLRYQSKLASRPMLTQSITTAVLFATGDTMAQQIVEQKGLKNHELARTARMAFYGGGTSR
jgi:protein Mpv17